MGFWNALSVLAPVAPALSDAQDIRTQRTQDAAKFAQDQELHKAQMTVQQLAAQSEQQRLRASTQPIFKEGTKPEFNPQSGTYQQPAWDDKKQSYSMVDVPGVSPQEQDKFQLESFNKNRTAAKSMMPPGTSDENLDYLAYTLSGMKPPPVTKVAQMTGDAGKPFKGNDGQYYVKGRNADGTSVDIPMGPNYNPPAVKPPSPAVQFTNLTAKQILANQRKGPPLTPEESASLQAAAKELTLNGISTATARAVENARYGITNITDDSGAEVAETRLNVANAAQSGTPYSSGTVGAPTAQDKKNQMLARSAISQINSMERVLAADPNLTGPGGGQLTKLQTWLGTNSPDSQQFLAAATFLSEHGVGVFGGRNIHSITDLQNLMGSLKTNPAALKAALEQARQTMQPWATAGGRLPGARGGNTGNNTSTYSQTATGPGGHKIGSNDGITWYDVQTGKKI
jgi:hypothetical protein